LVTSRRTRQTGFCGFNQAITGAIYFTFHVQITHQFKLFALRFLPRKNIEKKFVLISKNIEKELNFITIFMVT